MAEDKCPLCGNEVPESANFCPSCGQAMVRDNVRKVERKPVIPTPLPPKPEYHSEVPEATISEPSQGPKKVRCSRCSSELDVSSFTPGTQIRCSVCDQVLQVPGDPRQTPMRPAGSSLPLGDIKMGYGGGDSQMMSSANTYFVLSIIFTLLCCLPAGVVGIVYASNAKSKLQIGDVDAASAALNNAKIWTWVSFGLGLVVNVIVFFATLMGSAGLNY